MVAAWPVLTGPRVEMPVREDVLPAELCIVRHSASLEGLEWRLQFVMVAYVGGAKEDISPEWVLDILERKVDIPGTGSLCTFSDEGFLGGFRYGGATQQG